MAIGLQKNVLLQIVFADNRLWPFSKRNRVDPRGYNGLSLKIPSYLWGGSEKQKKMVPNPKILAVSNLYSATKIN